MVKILLLWFLDIGAILPSELLDSGLEIGERYAFYSDSIFTNQADKSLSYNTGHEISHLD
jgi:hypothetical protein